MVLGCIKVDVGGQLDPHELGELPLLLGVLLRLATLLADPWRLFSPSEEVSWLINNGFNLLSS